MRRLTLIASFALLAAAFASGQETASGYVGPAVKTNATVPTPPIAFVAIQPCRLADTRGNGFIGPFGPPALVALTARVFPVAGYCGIPNTAQAVSANLTVTEAVDRGWVAVWPEGAPQPSPLVSSINFVPGVNIANAVVAPLGTNGGITLYPRVGTHVVIDVNGYYVSAATLASGKTLKGVWTVYGVPTGAGDYYTTQISFPLTLPSAAAAPLANFIAAPGTASTANCPGTVTDPQAAPGQLCIYSKQNINATVANIVAASTATSYASDPYGAFLILRSSGAGQIYGYGTWAVTAP